MISPRYGRQGLLYARGADEFMEATRGLLKEDGIVVTSLLRIGDAYYIVASLETGWSHGSITSTWKPEEYLNLQGPNETYTTAMVKVGDLWQAYRAKYTGLTEQRVAVVNGRDELEDYIPSEWNRGRVVTDIVHDDGRHWVVTSGGLDWEQDWYLASGYPEGELITACTEQGMILTEMTPLDDQFLWILSSGTGYEFHHVEVDPSQQFLEMTTKGIFSKEGVNGYHLTMIREMNGKPCLVFAK